MILWRLGSEVIITSEILDEIDEALLSIVNHQSSSKIWSNSDSVGTRSFGKKTLRPDTDNKDDYFPSKMQGLSTSLISKFLKFFTHVSLDGVNPIRRSTAGAWKFQIFQASRLIISSSKSWIFVAKCPSWASPTYHLRRSISLGLSHNFRLISISVHAPHKGQGCQKLS